MFAQHAGITATEGPMRHLVMMATLAATVAALLHLFE